MSLYETDFFAWANEQAALLRAGKLAAVDIEHIAEEIEGMGRSEKRELLSRLARLLTHLLKWQVQPMRRGNSWRATIKVQRREIERHLADNPSLEFRLPEVLEAAYGDAVLLAARETGLAESSFPPTNPWAYDKIMDSDFWPSSRRVLIEVFISMNTVTVPLPDDVLDRLNALASKTGRTAADHISEAVLEHLDDLEDIVIAEQRLDDILAGRSKPIPIEEVMQRHGMED